MTPFELGGTGVSALLCLKMSFTRFSSAFTICQRQGRGKVPWGHAAGSPSRIPEKIKMKAYRIGGKNAGHIYPSCKTPQHGI
ncbi:hypothetical protein D1841_00045 [Neglecta sp. X4]|nr:hypothetical protein [Neglectibacter sp. 59]NBJ71750.1 hypothetical protein [Neglectibacter sp. X4]NCE79527.1 hypothetical protein [Neglectibacter sp. X58]